MVDSAMFQDAEAPFGGYKMSGSAGNMASRVSSSILQTNVTGCPV